jgi:hypothetical protein
MKKKKTTKKNEKKNPEKRTEGEPAAATDG